MVATITLQLDDQTGPGWAQFIENVRKAEQQAHGLQQALDMRTAIVGIGREAGEIAGLASALGAAAETARTISGSPPGGQPFALEGTGASAGEAGPTSSSPAELGAPLHLPAPAAADRRQQFQQTQLASLVSNQGLESEQVQAQSQLLQAAVNRARAQQKVDRQIVQMLADQIELEQQQQRAAEQTGQIVERLQAALIALLSATNAGAQQNRQANQGGP